MERTRLRAGQIAETVITGYSAEGLGVCRIDGCVVFVPNAIRGELCRVKVTHVSANSAHGRIEEILKRSPHRISRACAAAKLCGGCQYQHMDYAEELYAKAQKVTDALNRLGGQNLDTVSITGAGGVQVSDQSLLCVEEAPAKAEDVQAYSNGFVPPEAFAYRNKAIYPLAVKNGKPVAGFYKNRTHDVIPIARCAILPEVFDRAKDVVLRWAEEDRVSVYDERTGTGLLRHIYLRLGFGTGRLMVCIVANDNRLPRENRLVNALRRELPTLASVILAVNRKSTNVVLGDEYRTLWGSEEIEDVLCGFTFRLSPRSFYQVNHDQAQRLYEKAVELADLHGTETVLDLYCGTGTITLALSRTAGRVIGVEVVPQAIDDAKQNAVRNGVENVEFFCADAGEAAARFAASGTEIRAEATDTHVGTSIACPSTSDPAPTREAPPTAGLQTPTDEGTNPTVRQTPTDEGTNPTVRQTPTDEGTNPTVRQAPTDEGTNPTVRQTPADEGTNPTVRQTPADEGTNPTVRQAPTDEGTNPTVRQTPTDEGTNPTVRQMPADGRTNSSIPLHSAEQNSSSGPDVIVVDPPRKGLAPEVIGAMVQMAPKRIVYVSCDPATLGRDVKRLSEQGYTLTHVEAFDLFPRTFHVETVCLLSKLRTEQKVEIDLDLSELDLTAAESAATYQEIKDYVQETFGHRVTSLQIAQIKRKLGLPTGEHYNLSQKENQVIPNCPPEKESAIREALVHFRMI